MTLQFKKTTSNGVSFNFDNPTPGMIDIRCIAYELSMLNRWGGNLLFEYRVSQHSILVANNISRPEWRIYGLLHDAAEAYIGDVVSPLKAWITFQGADLPGLERRILDCVWRKFDLAAPTKEIAKAVHVADQRALATEWRDVVKGKNDDWQPQAPTFSSRIKYKHWSKVEETFLQHFNAYLYAAKALAPNKDDLTQSNKGA